MKINNLTPHELNIYNKENNLVMNIPVSGHTVRIEMSRVEVGEINGIPLFITEPGNVINLPEYEEGVINVVSGFVRESIQRADLWQPGELLRDENGRVIGAIGLSQ